MWRAPRSRCPRTLARRVERCGRSEEHTSELQSHVNLVCRLLLEKKNNATPAERIHDLTRSRPIAPSSSLPYRLAPLSPSALFFFFNDTATTEIYTLSLHDALPISLADRARCGAVRARITHPPRCGERRDRGVLARWRAAWNAAGDRKSTRLNSSHMSISYAVFCLKKKTTQRLQSGSTI